MFLRHGTVLWNEMIWTITGACLIKHPLRIFMNMDIKRANHHSTEPHIIPKETITRQWNTFYKCALHKLLESFTRVWAKKCFGRAPSSNAAPLIKITYLHDHKSSGKWTKFIKNWKWRNCNEKAWLVYNCLNKCSNSWHVLSLVGFKLLLQPSL